MLMENCYVFDPFWQHHNGIDGFEDWEEKFRASSRTFAQAFQAGDSVRVLSFVLDRLYVLRNQHGPWQSTWNSGANRAQVRDGAAILAFLMPVFVDLTMENSHEDWGRPLYPVVEKERRTIDAERFICCNFVSGLAERRSRSASRQWPSHPAMSLVPRPRAPEPRGCTGPLAGK